MLTVNNRTLKRESRLQYLGIVINDFATKKVNQRLELAFCVGLSTYFQSMLVIYT